MAGFLRQVWYIAGRTRELRDEGLLARTIAGTPVVLWRGPGGGPVALLDRCPHRLAPLSLGRLEPEGLRCGYHGLRFGADGHCTDNPHGPAVSALKAPAFPVIERHSFLWIWLGDASRADPAEIPDLGFIDRCPPSALIEDSVPTRANHQLLVDNILDLSHADYLHPATLGGGSTTRARAKVEREGGGLRVRWDMKGERPFPIHRAQIPEPALADVYLEVKWHVSGVMTVENGFKPAGSSQPEYRVLGVHAMIPETERATHYFYTVTRDFDVESHEHSTAVAHGLKAVFVGEDKRMIEAQQARIGTCDIDDFSPVLLQTDAAGTQARRIYARALLAEAEQRHESTAPAQR